MKRHRSKTGAPPSPTCVIFPGRRNSSGYGRVWRGSRRYLAHRLAWAERNGPIPAGMCVLHTCDTRECVNVAHLYLGTRRDNVRDMLDRGRQGFKVVLDAERARAIRAAFAEGKRVGELAREYGVNTGTVTCVLQGRTWR